MSLIDLGPHAVYIIAAYGAVGLAVVGLIGYAVAEARRARARLAALEARGIRRRSETTPS